MRSHFVQFLKKLFETLDLIVARRRDLKIYQITGKADAWHKNKGLT